MGWQGDDNEGCIPKSRPRAMNGITIRTDAVRAAAEVVGEYLQAPPSMWDTIERLITQRITPILSSRDTEVREVLEGLAKSFDHAAWKGFNQSDSEFEKGYRYAMEVAARNVREYWSKLQPKESSDVTE